MLKLRRTTESGTQIFLGLSDENIKRLREGKPIRIRPNDELGLPFETIIFSGETEDSMVETLEANGAIPPGSKDRAEWHDA